MKACAAPGPLRIAAAVAAGVVVLSLPPGAGADPAHRPPALGRVVVAELGFGYTVTSQGPLAASQFPTGSPSAAAAAGALRSLGRSIGTYQRSWQDPAGVNRVHDLVVRFPTDAEARAFVDVARRALSSGEIVSSGPLGSVPGAQRATYFASSDPAGVGQTVTMRAGDYAAVLSFLSDASGNPAPITKASAARIAEAQYAAMTSAGVGAVPAQESDGGFSGADVAWVAFVAAVLVATVATVFALRRRREATRPQATEMG